jgi:hypothetical protein
MAADYVFSKMAYVKNNITRSLRCTFSRVPRSITLSPIMNRDRTGWRTSTSTLRTRIYGIFVAFTNGMIGDVEIFDSRFRGWQRPILPYGGGERENEPRHRAWVVEAWDTNPTEAQTTYLFPSKVKPRLIENMPSPRAETDRYRSRFARLLDCSLILPWTS